MNIHDIPSIKEMEQEAYDNGSTPTEKVEPLTTWQEQVSLSTPKQQQLGQEPVLGTITLQEMSTDEVASLAWEMAITSFDSDGFSWPG